MAPLLQKTSRPEIATHRIIIVLDNKNALLLAEVAGVWYIIPEEAGRNKEIGLSYL